MNTLQVKEALKKKYESNEWALLFEVRNSTGHTRVERYADAIAMNLWPSRGLSVLGFEIKVSRGDWLNELKQPEKADPIIKYCDYFYLVVGDKNIIKGGELPDNWGLIVPFGENKLKIKKEAPRLKPIPLDKRFIASMMRQAMNQLTMEPEIRKQVNKRSEVIRNDLKRYYDKQKIETQTVIETMRGAITEFQEKTGINIYKRYSWSDIENQIEIVNFLKSGNIGDMIVRLKRIGVELQNITNGVNKLVIEQSNYNTQHKKLFPRPINIIE